MQSPCPLYPRKQTFAVETPMSGLGKADIVLLDNFVGASEHRGAPVDHQNMRTDGMTSEMQVPRKWQNTQSAWIV